MTTQGVFFSLPVDSPAPAPVDSDYVTGTLAHVTDHGQQAIDCLIEFFRDGPRNQAVLNAVGDQLQALEDAAWAMYGAFDPDTAVGDQLDLLGKTVGEARSGRSDAAYRLGVLVRIRINSSNGRIEEMLAVAVAMEPANTYSVTEADLSVTCYPALPPAGASELWRALKATKSATVRFNLVYPAALGYLVCGYDDSTGTTVTGYSSSAEGDPTCLVL